MSSLSDQQLLSNYAESRAEAAFSELVRRHVDLVHSAALRMVRDTHLAEDVTQGVFMALAQNARQLSNRPVVSGWLHRATQNLAANAVRSDVRRRAREKEAASMNELLAPEPDALWERISSHLDDALGVLSEADRDVVLLRFFESKSAREIAETLGTGEEAAQKRVSRAVERLRDLLAKRGITVGVSGLAAVISANAVQSAPVGLALTISTTSALAGTTIATTVTATTAKAIAMTTLQKTLLAATVVVVAGTGIYEVRRTSRLREQVQTLQQQQEPLTNQIQLLLKERDASTQQLAALRDDNERLNRNTDELLKLRGEVNRLRLSQGAPVRTADLRVPTTGAATSKESSPEDIGRELGMAVVRGEPAALQRVLELAKAEHEDFRTNSAGLNDSLRGELSRRTFAPLQAAFSLIADAAAKGNQVALDAVAQATQSPELNGMAIQSLGALAGNGNTDALEILLNHEKYGFLLSAAVGALQPAAENGNQRAIEFLAAVAKDDARQPLWYLAATGLSKAAESGNALAVDSLIALSGATNSSVQQAAVSGLKQAAAHQNAKAAEALRSMGVQR